MGQAVAAMISCRPAGTSSGSHRSMTGMNSQVSLGTLPSLR